VARQPAFTGVVGLRERTNSMDKHLTDEEIEMLEVLRRFVRWWTHESADDDNSLRKLAAIMDDAEAIVERYKEDA
jgi:hypothetical protein